MYGLADRGDKNKANSVFVLFSYKWANTTAIGNKTQTNEKLKWWLKKQTANWTRLMDQGQLWYSKHPLIRTCGLRTFWQKFATLIPQKYKNLLSQAISGRFLHVARARFQLNYDKQFNQGEQLSTCKFTYNKNILCQLVPYFGNQFCYG